MHIITKTHVYVKLIDFYLSWLIRSCLLFTIMPYNSIHLELFLKELSARVFSFFHEWWQHKILLSNNNNHQILFFSCMNSSFAGKSANSRWKCNKWVFKCYHKLPLHFSLIPFSQILLHKKVYIKCRRMEWKSASLNKSIFNILRARNYTRFIHNNNNWKMKMNEDDTTVGNYIYFIL